MNTVEIIKIKRDGGELTKQQIQFLINGYLNGDVADYQMSAFLMSVYLKGMTDDEAFFLTEIMLNSGKIVNLSDINAPKIDKHSTGGVGDKTSLILAPQIAAAGIYVPMISGRGLGHTGGTLDKLESIPGFNVNYSIEDYKKILLKTGLVMSGQTSELAPADKKIYSLRDVTATVDNVALITASIMSKKLAEGAEGIVFDVKMGNGANLQDKDLSVTLAKKLVSVSGKFGKKAIAVLTEMDEPLGYKIGNWLEVEECIEVMNGINVPDLVKVNNVLAGAMLFLGGKAKSIEDGEERAEALISDGSAFRKFREMVLSQNGSIDYIDDYKNLKRPEFSLDVKAGKNGFVTKMDAYKFGLASIELGCGRRVVTDKIDYLAGIILKCKTGSEVKTGETICTLYTSNEKLLKPAAGFIEKGIEIKSKKPSERKLILDIIE